MPTISEKVQDIINFITDKYPGLYEESAAGELRSTIEFILQQGGKIKKREKSDTHFLGDLGEEFGKCLFSEMIVKTPPEKSDFDAIINGKRFTVEVKTLSDLFNSLMVIMYEILNEQKDDKELCDKIQYLLKNCDLFMTPLDIHRKKDKENFKAKLRKILKDNLINFNQRQIFSIKCNKVNYEITIKINDIFSVVCGRPPNKTNQLAALFKKRDS
ncbi:MAG: hypothetical protein ABIK93_06110 [candidate division WOR-3 bacterium]